MTVNRILNGILFQELSDTHLQTFGEMGTQFDIQQTIDGKWYGTLSSKQTPTEAQLAEGKGLVGTAVSDPYYEAVDVVQWGRSAVGTREVFPAYRPLNQVVSSMIGDALQVELAMMRPDQQQDKDAASDMAYDIAANLGASGDDDDQSLVSVMELIALRWPHVANRIFRSV